MKTKPTLRSAFQPAPFALLFSALFLVTSCSKDDNSDDGNNATTSIESTTAVTSGTVEGSTETGANANDNIDNTTSPNTVSIDLGSTTTITNPLLGNGVTVSQSGGDVTINSSATGVNFKLSGNASGSVKISSLQPVKLTLDNASLTNASGPAISLESAQGSYIVLTDNSVNTVIDGNSYGTSSSNATISSTGKLVISGNGSLSVKGNYRHAIASDDYIRIRSGKITITGAAVDGIHANTGIIADGGTIKITASNDGFKSASGRVIVNGGDLTVNSGYEAISASAAGDRASAYINLNGGNLDLKSSAGKGIQAEGALTINKGTVATVSSNDALYAGTSVYINGGDVYAYSTTADGISSDGSITISGGRIVAVGAQGMESGIDCGSNALKVTGGVLVGVGGSTSSPSTSSSTVSSVIRGSGSAGQIVHIQSADGKEALTFEAPVSYSTMLYASSKLKNNTTYNMYVGGSVDAGTSFHGLYTGGRYNNGTSASAFTTTSVVTKVGGTVN